jgi:hypothetical protein
MRLIVDTIIGIDPGYNGGLAVFTPSACGPSQPPLVRLFRMPRETADVVEVLRQLRAEGRRPLAFLEKLNIRHSDISVEDGRANMGKLYNLQKMIQNYEQLRAVLQAEGVPYALVHPLKWQSDLGLRASRYRGEDKAARKRRYRDTAQELHPDLRVTLWSADALLIARWGWYIARRLPAWLLSNVPTWARPLVFE